MCELEKYIIGIDQSTQGTKAVLFDQKGTIVVKAVKNHQQLISPEGWISHDLNEIYTNVILLIQEILNRSKIDSNQIIGIGLTNQRETATAWSKLTGMPLADAIVWQCSRASELCHEIEQQGCGKIVRQKTGMTLSPYFTASKFSWYLKNSKRVQQAKEDNDLCLGTIDSWLLYQLTKGKSFKTELSNASRTQLLNIDQLEWDQELCTLFDIPINSLPEIVDSDAQFGYTDFDGLLKKKVPICSIMGDSQSALFGQGCLKAGDVKSTYGTGSSIMMNLGEHAARSEHGLMTSIAWKIKGKVNYVLEGNINYSGAVVNWLKDDLQLIAKADETEALANQAFPNDTTYLVPAFTGLGAPYWNDKATALIIGMTRMTGKAEIVRSALECIAYQINDVLQLMEEDVKSSIDNRSSVLKVDGGAISNNYLMQFQSDISNINLLVPNITELSVLGTAFNAGITLGIYSNEMCKRAIKYKTFQNHIDQNARDAMIGGWSHAVQIAAHQ